MGCKHKWVRSGYGNDLICTKCGYAAKQGVLTMPTQDMSLSISSQPMARETIEIPICTGNKSERVSVYKDELIKELQRSLDLDIAYNVMQGGA